MTARPDLAPRRPAILPTGSDWLLFTLAIALVVVATFWRTS